MDRPLAGRTILLPRPEGRGAELGRRLEALGARVAQHPASVLVPPRDPGAVERALGGLDRFGWIVFTSVAGVEFFERGRMRAGGPRPALARAAAVGPATARALARYGWAPALVARGGDAAALAAELAGVRAPHERVLLVQPERASPALAAALVRGGADVEAVAFYRNVCAPGLESVARELVGGRYDVVVFTAGSTLVHLLGLADPGRAALVRALGAVVRVAIGGPTARALAAAGLAPDAVAFAPTDDALAAAVLRAACASIRPLPEAAVSTAALRTTPLHALHVAAGARMVEFAGWHMPLQYSGVVDEHMAVRTRAGLFDVSHMGQAQVTGADALAFLQALTCNDVSALKIGRAQYNALTTEGGTFVDDLLIYRLEEARFLLVLNAGNTAKDLDWLAAHRAGFDVRVDDQSADWALIAVQGPQAAAIVQALVEQPLGGVRYYGFVEAAVAGSPAIVSRTGYTGEDGFELYVPSARAPEVWSALVRSGTAAGIVPAGLGARDTLRLEAKMALYGKDIDETTSVLEADLGWILKPEKGAFVGREALVRQASEGVSRKLVGFQMVDRAIARDGYACLHEGRPVGRVTSGTHAPFLRRNIGLAYLPAALTAVGTPFQVDVRGRVESAVVVPTPFYTRAR